MIKSKEKVFHLATTEDQDESWLWGYMSALWDLNNNNNKISFENILEIMTKSCGSSYRKGPIDQYQISDNEGIWHDVPSLEIKDIYEWLEKRF